MMEYAEWRNHRGCLIVEGRTPILRRRRYSVWKDGAMVGTFRNTILAELFVDGLLD